jgi:hypothetical protein
MSKASTSVTKKPAQRLTPPPKLKDYRGKGPFYLSALLDLANSDLTDAEWDMMTRWDRSLMKRLLKQLSPEARRLVGAILEDELPDYNFVPTTRLVLGAIADHNAEAAKSNPWWQALSLKWPTMDRAPVINLPAKDLFVFIQLYPKGLAFEVHPVFQMLWGLKGAELIRRCLVCEKLFFAGRSDRWGCSSACSDTIRARRSRTEKARRQRSESRKHREYLKHKRESRNSRLRNSKLTPR